MLRFETHVTVSPTTWRRSSSASSATAPTSRPGRRRGHDLVLVGHGAGAHGGEHLGHGTGGAGVGHGEQGRRVGLGADVPLGGSSTHQHDLGPVAHVLRLAHGLRVHHAGVVAEALGIGAIEDGEVEVGVEPAIRPHRVLGVDREPRGQLEPGRLGDGAEPITIGPRALRG